MSFDSVRQLSAQAARKLDLRPRATVRCTPAVLEARTRLRFQADEDDFDSYQAAILRLEPSEERAASYAAMPGFFDSAGRAEAPVIFMMQRYDHEPAGHLTIFLPCQMDSATSTASALTRIAAALDLPQPEAFAV